ncbi:winged helix-turn-helix transcriptional regulator [Rosistilla ulvae]|nr:helix-turn-helix domain-containing protein [Rosistilla ulvae]
MHKLTRREIAVWMILYRDTRNGTARTSQGNIARRAGMSVKSVKIATGKLIDAGLIRVVFQGGLNRGPSRFQVDPLGNRGSVTGEP